MNLKKLVRALAAALVLAGVSQAHAAIVFQFSWASAGSTPAPATAVGYAIGSFTLAVGPGASFTAADVTSLDITVETNVHGPIQYDDLADLVAFSGTVDAAGTSVSFIDLFLGLGGSASGFGCSALNCADGQISFIDKNTDAYNYGSADAARASFVTTVAAVPEPGVLALVGLGLACLALTRTRRA